MTVNYKDKQIELKFTFNSFRYMQDFDVQDLERVQTKIFMMIGLSRDMLMGALNKEPYEKYTYEQVDEILEPYVESGEILQLFGDLSELLMESSFFTSLRALGEQAV